MSTLLTAWAGRWGVPYAALLDLQREMAMDAGPAIAAPVPGETSESAVQARVRLEAAEKGVYLWRNQSGAMQNETGRWVRFGLCNDSKALNEHIKSADLVGIRPVVITPQHVGHTIGQFVAREVKEAGWSYGGTAREEAQLRFLNLVLAAGGDAAFAPGTGTL